MSKFKVGDRVMVEAEVFIAGTDGLDGLYGLRVGDHELGFVGVREEFMTPVPTPTGKTVKVRMAVLVGPEGEWVAQGASRMSDAVAEREVREWVDEYQTSGWRLSFIEADVPAPDIPVVQTVPGKVVSDD